MVPPASAARPDGPLRLLWLIDSLALGGAEALVPTFARHADRRRLHLDVCFLKRIGDNPFEAELASAGAPGVHLGARNLRDVAAFHRLTRLARERDVALIHAHLNDAAIYGVVAARRSRRPCVVTLHVPPGDAPLLSRVGLRERLMAALVRASARRVLAVSDAVRDAWVSRRGFDPARTRTVYNGVDCDAFAAPGLDRDAARRALGLAPADRVVLTVCALREGKGLERLLEAIARIAGRVPQAVLVVAGDGPSGPALAARARELGVDGRVRWLGFRRDVPVLMRASDVFALPSLHDALPTALLEAMAAGLAVVAARVGGIPEIVDAPRTGRLVAPDDAAALAEVVTELLERPEERERLAAAARQAVRERFSASAWIARLEAVYAEVLAEPRGAS